MIGVRAVLLRLELRRCQLGDYMRKFRLNAQSARRRGQSPPLRERVAPHLRVMQ